MGKDLKGRECGKGLSQRKDKRYSARYVKKSGKRLEKYFKTLPEAKKWLEDARYKDQHNEFSSTPVLTVDEWFELWRQNIVCDLAQNTQRNYQERYEKNIQPVIGKMMLTDVKPLHCKMVLNSMYANYAGSTIRLTYITMGTLFRSAVMNGLISKHPMDGVRYTKPIREVSDIRFLTLEEQKRFMATAKCSHNYPQYELILETGLRTGEMIGLTFDAIDFDMRTLSINKTLEYRYQQGCWRAGSPKTQSSYRTIPLTNRAYEILKAQYENRDKRKESEMLSTVLEFIDRKTGQTKKFVMRDLVFVNYRTGEPIKNSSYDTHLYKLCDKAGIERFSMHALRHTYATRAIESGMQPKILQELLGHSSIKITMDRYVHTTDESMLDAIRQFEERSFKMA